MSLIKTLRFDDDVLEILRNLIWTDDGLTAKITEKLDRPVYEKVNKALFAMGGVWKGGKVQAHVFEKDPRPLVEGLLQSGAIEVVRDGFFETPEPVVRMMIDKAEIGKNMSCLEPSAGKGAIAKFIKVKTSNLVLIEKNHDRATLLKLEGYDRMEMDFLEYDKLCLVPYMRIVMNPPFEEGQDVDHVRHAYDLLNAKGGRLIAIMGEHAFFAEDKKSVEFRAWFKSVKGWSEKLPEGSFKSSGTGVNARIVVINKGKVQK